MKSKSKVKFRIVLSFTLAVTLALTGCLDSTNQLADDVADKVESVATPTDAPDAAPFVIPTDDGIGTSPSGPREGGIIIQKAEDIEAAADTCPVVLPLPCAVWIGANAEQRRRAHGMPNMIVYTGNGTSCVDAYFIAEDYWGTDNFVLRYVEPGWTAL